MKALEAYIETGVGSFFIATSLYDIVSQKDPGMILADITFATAGLILILLAIKKYRKIENEQNRND